MSLNLTKSTLRLDTAVGAAKAQAICKATLQLPEEKPEIRRILAPEAEARLDSSSVKVIDGKVLVEGRLALKVPYVANRSGEFIGDREPIAFFVSEEPVFLAELDMLEVQEGMDAAVEVEVDSFEVDNPTSRTLSVTAIVKVFGRVTSPVQNEYVVDISDADPEKFKFNKKLLFTESRVGETIGRVTVRDAFQVPEGKADIGEVSDYAASVYISSNGLRVSGNRVSVAGTLDLKIAYVGDLEEKPQQFLDGPQIDFQTVVDLPGAVEGVRAQGKGFVESLTLTKVGTRTFQVEAVIGIQVTASVLNETSVVTEINACGEDSVDVLRSGISLESLVGQVSGEASVTDTFSIGSGKPDIDDILMTYAKARIMDARVVPDKVTLLGEVDVYMTYAGVAAEPGEVAEIDSVQQLGLPFEVSIDVTGIDAGMITFATADVVSADTAKAGPRTYDVEVKVSSNVKVLEEVALEAITDAAVVPAVVKSSSPNRRITVYVVQQGDTMWKVARRYGKAMARISEANRLGSEELYMGQKLIIPG